MLLCHIYMVYPEPTSEDPIPALTPGQQRMIAGLEIFLCSSLPTQLLIGSLLRATGWVATEVAPLVNKPANDVPACVEPWHAEAPPQRSLF